MFLVLSLICGLLASLSAYPTGAPKEACKQFTAKHENHVPQNGIPKFDITVNPSSVAPGQTVTVTIKGIGGETFKGFLIQGVWEHSNSTAGKFQVKAGESQELDCESKADSATHVSEFSAKDNNKQVQLQWQAPEAKGRVVFRAVVVKNFEIFWDNIRSKPLVIG